jgi:hypothetical protein
LRKTTQKAGQSAIGGRYGGNSGPGRRQPRDYRCKAENPERMCDNLKGRGPGQ